MASHNDIVITLCCSCSYLKPARRLSGLDPSEWIHPALFVARSGLQPNAYRLAQGCCPACRDTVASSSRHDGCSYVFEQENA